MSKNLWRYIVVALLLPVSLLETKAQAEYNPVAKEEATVIEDNCRFTILTPRMIRMEWMENGQFVDNASLVFVNRNVNVPEYSTSKENGWLTIDTKQLTLKYKIGSGSFKADNISILSKMEDLELEWNPLSKDEKNLKGTTRTLDQIDGATPLEDGVLSREGWTLIDDTQKPVFDNTDWPWVMSRPEQMEQDWYFMAYGADYKQALADYTLVAGRVAFPPKYAFGTWQSRWWKYTDEELKELVNEYKMNDFPLDVLVIDMDWHIVNLPEMYDGKNKMPDQAGQGAGWTGFTWNENYFPDPKEFMDWTDQKGLKTCMNLHPASGIQPHEAVYSEFAKAMGIDPKTKDYVPFNITDKNFASNYFNLVLNPLEDQGIDFWWLDWQQWNNTDIPGVNPTYYLNYLHYTDMQRRDKARPLIYHRWGGLGNHRYQIGFSGDTYNTWKCLQFQPYFTATASNVGWGYWGHDLGGFFKGEEKPELFTRWIQYGVFTPIMKVHYWAHPAMDRRPWAYPPLYANAMRKAYKLRYSLVPYIYTMAYQAYETGICLCRPMYYESNDEKAYTYKDQFYFGDDMLIAPVIDSLGQHLSAEKKVWLPEGQWIDLTSGCLLDGDQEYVEKYTISEIPVFVKAGAIIPMMPDMNNTKEKAVNPLILNVYPGANGKAVVYDDEGDSQGYQDGEFTLTNVTSAFDKNNCTVTIAAIEGAYDEMLKARAYELRFPISLPPVEVTVNGEKLSFTKEAKQGTWTYNGRDAESIVYTPEFSVNEDVTIVVEFPKASRETADGIKGLIARSHDAFYYVRENHWADWKYAINNFVEASQTGTRVTLNPETATDEFKSLRKLYKNNCEQINECAENNKRYQLINDLLN